MREEGEREGYTKHIQDEKGGSVPIQHARLATKALALLSNAFIISISAWTGCNNYE